MRIIQICHLMSSYKKYIKLFTVGVGAFLFCLIFTSFMSVLAVEEYGAPDEAAGCPVVYKADGTTWYGAIEAEAKNSFPACATVETGKLGFQIPSLGDILTFAIRAFFVIAGLAALFYLLLGAMAWVTSGGDKDAITAAREKIQAAVLGMIMIVAVLAVIWTLEQVIFKRRICLGLSCPLTLPGLIERTQDGDFCCVCINRANNSLGSIVNTSGYKCDDGGNGIPL